MCFEYTATSISEYIFSIWGVVFLVSFPIQIWVCWLLYSCLQRIPISFRQQRPGMAFLLLIPVANIFLNFKVFPLLARSYRAYFDSIGKLDVGDCGYEMGVAYCVCGALALVPFIGIFAGPAAVVLAIVYLVKAWRLRAMIPANEGIRGGG